ncbi:hypothetical protein Tco_0049686 [Tanacetum coccineum]
MSQRRLSATKNRLEGGIPLRIPLQVLSRCIQRIPSNKNSQGGGRENSIHHKPKNILLLQNALRFEERWSDLPTFGRQSIPKANWQKFGGLRRRPTAKGVGIRVVDSHIGNHPKDDFTPLKTIRRLCSVFGRRSHLGFKGETAKLKGRVRHQAP